MVSLKTINRAVFCDSAPSVRMVRCRTVVKTLSIGLAVRREIEEGQQSGPILDQAVDRASIFSARISWRKCRWRPQQWKTRLARSNPTGAFTPSGPHRNAGTVQPLGPTHNVANRLTAAFAKNRKTRLGASGARSRPPPPLRPN